MKLWHSIYGIFKVGIRGGDGFYGSILVIDTPFVLNTDSSTLFEFLAKVLKTILSPSFTKAALMSNYGVDYYVAYLPYCSLFVNTKKWGMKTRS